MENNQQQNDNGLGAPELPPMDGEFIGAEQVGEQPQQQGAGMAELFKMLAVNLCAFVAQRKGEHWNISAVEADSFAEAADKVAGLYIKDGQMSPWLGLGVVVGAFALPRMAIDAMNKKQQQKPEPSNEQQPG